MIDSQAIMPLSPVLSEASSSSESAPPVQEELKGAIVSIPENWDLDQANLELLEHMEESDTNKTAMPSYSSSQNLEEDLYLS